MGGSELLRIRSFCLEKLALPSGLRDSGGKEERGRETRWGLDIGQDGGRREGADALVLRCPKPLPVSLSLAPP